mmetsp:Transcript_30512/g.49165  ORF Transcript_30512/g.49165 Transcript_30512/m.49165 type:complete len:98 (-) Transcript_30512:337-630(-)
MQSTQDWYPFQYGAHPRISMQQTCTVVIPPKICLQKDMTKQLPWPDVPSGRDTSVKGPMALQTPYVDWVLLIKLSIKVVPCSEGAECMQKKKNGQHG